MLLEKFNHGRQPAARMVEHSAAGCYVIIHFGLNTYTDKEWGYGNADPALFNPVNFDANQWAQTCKDCGFDGLILVCKHHDGFCLWPTETTDYNISRSPFRNGRGDLVREVSDACRACGIKMGFYCSPWDRHDADYGTEKYVRKFQQQIRELLTNYGEAFEMWFDGANGGDGWYGGKEEKRTIDNSTYYRWEETFEIVRTLQPNAAIFSNVGPDLRWVGNEKGFADAEMFGCITPRIMPNLPGTEPLLGNTDYTHSPFGDADGRFYMPPECDVPLRPGWFYHAREDKVARSCAKLIDIYLRSAGCGGFLNLGLAPAPDGRLHPNDVMRLQEFKAAQDKLFEDCIFSGEKAVENNSLTIDLPENRQFNLLELSEGIASEEKVTAYQNYLDNSSGRSVLLSGKAIGRRRLKKLSESVSGKTLTIAFENSTAVPEKLSIKLFNAQFPVEIKGENEVGNLVNYPLKDIKEWYFELDAPGDITGFIFTPCSEAPAGTPTHYRFLVKNHNDEFVPLCEGEFSNIQANPIPQQVMFSRCFIVWKFKLEITSTLYDAEPCGVNLALIREE